MIKITKPNFWHNKSSLISILLLPLSFFWIILTRIRGIILKSKKYDIPIICVGNIYVGGTGKTPLSIKIANEFKVKRKKRSVIVRKFYKNHNDEHKLILENTKELILNRNRSLAVEEAIKKNYDLVILDDGFQDYSIKKDLNILCFNSEQLIGNGQTFPAGPLRESISSVKKADLIIINGKKNIKFEKKIKKISKTIKIYYSSYLPLNINKFKKKNILAFAGIGNPENFFKTLKKYNLKVKKTLAFPDHYRYKKNDINEIIKLSKKEKLKIITTEKDFFRLKDYKIKEIDYLKLDLNIKNKSKLMERIFKLV